MRYNKVFKYYREYYDDFADFYQYFECDECNEGDRSSIINIKHQPSCSVPAKEKADLKKYQKQEKLKDQALKKLTLAERMALGV